MSKIDVDSEHVKEFYDDRYLKGYMEEWPPAKKRRVLDLIRALPLPRTGKVLDYGCGAGVFTELLRQGLPGWRVYGMELSEVALGIARKRFTSCQFLALDEVAREGPFDFVFTHHVLEHVTSLDEVLGGMSRVLAPHAFMFHILPCGNAGSFEQRLCLLRKEGVQRDANNRFCFEDSGHLRRLTSQELAARLEPFGFRVRDAWFANQFWGALDWITDLDRGFVWTLTNPVEANGAWAGLTLTAWFIALMTLQALKHPPRFVRRPVQALMERVIRSRVEGEWAARQHDPSGSEMYLLLERRAGPGPAD